MEPNPFRNELLWELKQESEISLYSYDQCSQSAEVDSYLPSVPKERIPYSEVAPSLSNVINQDDISYFDQYSPLNLQQGNLYEPSLSINELLFPHGPDLYFSSDFISSTLCLNWGPESFTKIPFADLTLESAKLCQSQNKQEHFTCNSLFDHTPGIDLSLTNLSEDECGPFNFKESQANYFCVKSNLPQEISKYFKHREGRDQTVNGSPKSTQNHKSCPSNEITLKKIKKTKVNSTLAFRIKNPSEPIANKPKFEGDRYSPIFIRGCRKEKEGMCPECYEAGEEVWFRMKFSGYWYHLNYIHGIGSDGHPFEEPEEVRLINEKGRGDKNGIKEALCSQCKQWVSIESVRNERIPGIRWKKHAQQCHFKSKKI